MMKIGYDSIKICVGSRFSQSWAFIFLLRTVFHSLWIHHSSWRISLLFSLRRAFREILFGLLFSWNIFNKVFTKFYILFLTMAKSFQRINWNRVEWKSYYLVWNLATKLKRCLSYWRTMMLDKLREYEKVYLKAAKHDAVTMMKQRCNLLAGASEPGRRFMYLYQGHVTKDLEGSAKTCTLWLCKRERARENGRKEGINGRPFRRRDQEQSSRSARFMHLMGACYERCPFRLSKWHPASLRRMYSELLSLHVFCCWCPKSNARHGLLVHY